MPWYIQSCTRLQYMRTVQNLRQGSLHCLRECQLVWTITTSNIEDNKQNPENLTLILCLQWYSTANSTHVTQLHEILLKQYMHLNWNHSFWFSSSCNNWPVSCSCVCWQCWGDYVREEGLSIDQGLPGRVKKSMCKSHIYLRQEGTE